jgi:hypothetical protein
MTLGGVTASNGIVDLLATGAASDITLGANITATNTGLTAAQPGIRAVAGRDVLVGSTTSLTTLGSGGITLQAARDVNLKVNDGGNNASANSIQAVGNLVVTATGGQIVKTDGNALSLDAANVALNASTTIGAFDGTITATAGNVALNANGAVAFTAINAAGSTGSIAITSNAASISGGTLSAGQDVTLTLNAGSGVALGAITAGTGGNGSIAITNSGASDITLNGNLQTTRSGLADNVAAISVTSGRDILLASTTSLVTNTSGAIRLNAAGAINLKVNDGGNNASANSIQAAGNLDITAGTSISRTDGNGVNLSGKA